MSVKGSKISVVVTATTVQFDKAMKGVKREIKDTSAQMKKFSAGIGTVTKAFGAVAVAGTAFVAAGGAVVNSSLKQIKELKTLAQVSGMTVESFQQGAFAARQAGIEQDKYADILKDVNDKLGDFNVASSGGMVDFFEKIAPKVGITAESFKNLSSQESLGLYVQSLEKANVSQQEMTFYMEALASDSTALLPLLTNNGKAMAEYANRAKELGIGMSDIEVEKAIQAQTTLDALSTVVGGQLNSAVAELAPFITGMTERLLEFVAASGGIKEFIIPGMRAIVQAVGFVSDAFTGIGLIFKTLKVGFLTLSSLITTNWYMVVDGILTGINSIVGKASTMFKDVADMVRPLNETLASSLDGMAESIKDTALETPQLLEDMMNSQQEALAAGVKEIHDTISAKPDQIGFVEAYDEMVAAGEEAAKKAVETREAMSGGDEIETSEIEAPEFNLSAFRKSVDNWIGEYKGKYHQLEQADLAHIEAMKAQAEQAYADGVTTFAQYQNDMQRLQMPLDLASFDFEAFQLETEKMLLAIEQRNGVVTEKELEELRKRQEILKEAENQELITTDQFEGATGEIEGATGGQPEPFNFDQFQEQSELMLEAMRGRYSMVEAEDYAHQERMREQLEQAKQSQLITEDQYRKESERLDAASEAAKMKIADRGMQGVFSAFASGSEKIMKLQKAYAIGKAGVNIAEGITAANSLVFPLNLIEMARVVAVGASSLASIKSAGKGVSGSPRSASSAGGGSSAASGAAASTQQQQSPNRVFNVDLTGSSSTSAEQTRNLLEMINEQAGDNMQINLKGA